MPKRKTICSLQRLCLEKVAANMEHIWVNDMMKDKLYQDHVCSTERPFSVLADSLVQELLQLLRNRLRLSCTILHFLLVPQPTELNLSDCQGLVSEDIAQTITVRCKELLL